MRILFGSVLVSVALLLSGCAREQQAAKFEDFPGVTPITSSSTPAVAAAPASTSAAKSDGNQKQLIVTPTDGLNGRVSRVNPNLRFVVLTFPVGQMPVVNRRLNLYRQGLKVGEVSVTGPQRNDSIVADITAGDAEAGDEARDN
jgi:hypothetical protein